MDRDAFFWQIQDGKRPRPKIARTLGMTILRVDEDAGTLEAEFEGRDEFTNPAGKHPRRHPRGDAG